MKRGTHNITYTCMCASLCALMCLSCENKHDGNGALGGMWQMTEWISPSGETVRNVDDQIYLSFRNQLARFHKMPRGAVNYFLSYFQVRGDSISFRHIVNYPTDTVCGNRELLPYGIGSNAAMKIEKLTSGTLILSNRETGTITYRKY